MTSRAYLFCVLSLAVFSLTLSGSGPVVFAANSVDSTDTQVSVKQAIKAYQEALDTEDRNHRVQQFRRSERLFEKAIDQQLDSSVETISPDLFVNLGNAALGAEDLGVAILSFRRALTVDADHRQAKQNLTHARSLLPKWVAREDDAVAFGSFMKSLLSRSREELMGLATMIFVVTMLLAAIYIRAQARWARNLSILAGVVWFSLVLATTALRDSSTTDLVVIATEVVARSADSINAPARFPEPVPAGTELTLLEDRGDWVHARFSDGREAWIQTAAIGWVSSVENT